MAAEIPNRVTNDNPREMSAVRERGIPLYPESD
jgi:hypothetical protein